MGNLAHGRALQTETACGRHATESFCAYAEDAARRCQPPACGRCSGAHAGLAHPPAAMADSPFRRPRTWWQAAGDAPQETIRLDLEAAFYFTHLILVFKSPRPAAMVLERSQDFGETWKPYKYFAANCSAAFGLEDDVARKGALCTSRYSSPFPCTGGEVSLPGQPSALLEACVAHFAALGSPLTPFISQCVFQASSCPSFLWAPSPAVFPPKLLIPHLVNEHGHGGGLGTEKVQRCGSSPASRLLPCGNNVGKKYKRKNTHEKQDIFSSRDYR